MRNLKTNIKALLFKSATVFVFFCASNAYPYPAIKPSNFSDNKIIFNSSNYEINGDSQSSAKINGDGVGGIVYGGYSEGLGNIGGEKHGNVVTIQNGILQGVYGGYATGGVASYNGYFQ